MVKPFLLVLLLVVCVSSVHALTCDGTHSCDARECYTSSWCNGTVCVQSGPSASGVACSTVSHARGLCDGEGICVETDACPSECTQYNHPCKESAGVCNATTDGCFYADKVVGASCQGGDPTAGYAGYCTDTGVCEDLCADVTCPDDCNSYFCNSATGNCDTNSLKANGSECTDAASGAKGRCYDDVCAVGECADVCPFSRDLCTEGVCDDPSVGCYPAAKSNTTFCYTDSSVPSHCDGLGKCVDPCDGVVCGDPSVYSPCVDHFCEASSADGYACLSRPVSDPQPCLDDLDNEGTCGNGDGMCHPAPPAPEPTTCPEYECLNSGDCFMNSTSAWCECVSPYHGNHCQFDGSATGPATTSGTSTGTTAGTTSGTTAGTTSETTAGTTSGTTTGTTAGTTSRTSAATTAGTSSGTSAPADTTTTGSAATSTPAETADTDTDTGIDTSASAFTSPTGVASSTAASSSSSAYSSSSYDSAADFPSSAVTTQASAAVAMGAVAAAGLYLL